MAGLRSLHHIHPLRRLEISAAVLPRLAGALGMPPAGAPNIAVIYVVIVRHAYGRRVAQHIAEAPAEEIPLPQVIESGVFQGQALDSVAGGVLINLVADPEQNVRFVVFEVAKNLPMRKAEVVDARQRTNHNSLFIV